MSTTACDDQFTVGTQTIETVHQPYDTVAILRRNIADMEVALRAQTELKERAEAELAKLRELPNVPIDAEAFEIHRMNRLIAADPKMNAPSSLTDEQIHAAYRNALGQSIRERDMPEIRKFAPVPAPHKGATHCDDCGLTWLDDGLNPLGCPYCKTHASERNARRYLALRKVGVQVPGYDFVKFDWSLDAAADRLLEGGE